MSASLSAIQEFIKATEQLAHENQILHASTGKFFAVKSLPSQAVSPSLPFSELIGKINPASPGTVLTSEGTPAAVVFNMKQYVAIENFVSRIPDLIAQMNNSFAQRTKMKSLGDKLISTVVVPLRLSVIVAVAGLFFNLVGLALLIRAEYVEDKTNKGMYHTSGCSLCTAGCLAIGLSICAAAAALKAASISAKLYNI